MQLWQFPVTAREDEEIVPIDVKRLEFYRWLVDHGRDPEFWRLPKETYTLKQALDTLSAARRDKPRG
jgi:hypothetical protein